ncbi:MAG TPA: undecaprenyldiphospho-muramoylpentapeptide beta-N-acetylglucosaminyltransferase [Thermodesulfovibrionales bacterium]|nr:undecaprenyldiphospho-muramoylpentapeptide beta-N-acetylglucosaminyltransferase [Thermodesulfovibrionales bacterium]
MRILIAGGGTGGHLFPGIAIAEELRRRDKSTDVYFIGTEHGIEASIVPREGYPIKYIRAEGVVGKSLLKTMRAVLKMSMSMVDSFRLLRDIRPDALIGLGGYASFGPALVGSLKSIPTVIMEQNAVPGLANRLLGKIVDIVCVTYHESMSYFPKNKTYITGNPVRKGIVAAKKDEAYEIFGLEKGRFTIFIFGGSSGARKINSALCGAFTYLHDIRDKIQFLHQTGKNDLETVRDTYRKWEFKGTVAAFIHQMPEAYAAADLVISRAGATTLAELTAVGRPAILVPYPFAAGNHQEFNAQRLAEIGAARVILDHELDSETLSRNIRDLYEKTELRSEMQRSSKSLGKPEAAQRVMEIVMSLVRKEQEAR